MRQEAATDRRLSRQGSMRRLALIALSAPLLLAPPAFAAGPQVSATPSVASCAKHGQGFISIPGSETCLRIGGRVSMVAGTGPAAMGGLRPDARIGSGASSSGYGTGVSGRVEMDARTPTEAGTLRTFVRIRAGSGTGTVAAP